jgi:hypothetical protein
MIGGADPALWIPEHTWVWSPPPGAPPWAAVDLREYARPQSFLLRYWNTPFEDGDELIFLVCLLSLVVGVGVLGWVILKTLREASTIAPGANSPKAHNHARLALAAGVLMIVATVVALPIHVSAPSSRPELLLSEREIFAGSGSYVLRIKSMPNALVWIRYSIDGEEPRFFSATLDSKGEARFDVSADTRKGTYRLIAFSRKNSLIWTNTDASITIK